MFLEVHTSFSNRQDAERIAHILVKERLAACVNILDMHSIYPWKGKIESESEALVIFKTLENIYPALESRLKELHPYEVPMITALAIQTGSESYLAWLEQNLAKEE